MMTMLGAMTTTSVLITAEAMAAARGAAASILGADRPTSRSWLGPADARAGSTDRCAA